MPRPKKTSRQADTTVLYVRGVPPTLARKLRAAAALKGEGLPGYVIEVLEVHVADLERKGVLPKGK